MRKVTFLLASLCFSSLVCVTNAWNTPSPLFVARRVEATRLHAVSWSSSSSTPRTDTGRDDFFIRDSQFADLGRVADIIISSFYVNATSPWTHMYRMSELNRIQQNFPYGDKGIHRMLVAVSAKDQNEIIGFCDIDARKAKAPSYRYNPRPYLSDLAVHPDWRRKGIARRLIQTCEDFCTHELKRDELYIRVEEINTAARQMYHKLNYYEIPDLEKRKGVIMLKKNLRDSLEPYIV